MLAADYLMIVGWKSRSASLNGASLRRLDAGPFSTSSSFTRQQPDRGDAHDAVAVREMHGETHSCAGVMTSLAIASGVPAFSRTSIVRVIPNSVLLEKAHAARHGLGSSSGR